MDRGSIINYLMHGNTEEIEKCRTLIEQMEAVKDEIMVARSMFNNVDDDDLIEVAIYSENVARKRYDYLLSIARKKGIRVGYDYVIDKNLRAAE